MYQAWSCISGETGAADGPFLPSRVSWDSRYEAAETINRSTIKYTEELEAELSSMPGYKKLENAETEKESLKSRTDPECVYMHHARKRGWLSSYWPMGKQYYSGAFEGTAMWISGNWLRRRVWYKGSTQRAGAVREQWLCCYTWISEQCDKKRGGEVMKRKTNVLYVCGRVFRVSETDL